MIFILLFIIIFSLIYIFYPRYCDICKEKMKLKIDENSELIYKCQICGQIKRTGIYAGNND